MFTVFETWSLRLLLEKTIKAVSYMPKQPIVRRYYLFFSTKDVLALNLEAEWHKHGTTSPCPWRQTYPSIVPENS
jgi:hypothetical protein